MEGLLARRATFKTIRQSTKADWDIIIAHHMPFAARLADRVLAQLRLLERMKAAVTPSAGCSTCC